jgi:hypothetical protein
MEAAAIMAIALANGGVSVFFSSFFVVLSVCVCLYLRFDFDYLKLLLFVL